MFIWPVILVNIVVPLYGDAHEYNEYIVLYTFTFVVSSGIGRQEQTKRHKYKNITRTKVDAHFGSGW